jgi:DNA repair protein RadC
MSRGRRVSEETPPEYRSAERPTARALADAALDGMADSDPRVEAIRALLAIAVGTPPKRGQRIGSAGDVAQYLRRKLETNQVEEFWAIALDVRHRVIAETMLSRGSLTGVEVHPRDAFRPLIAMGAAAVIFCHNHPSGDPTPSRQDLELTARLREVGEICGIAVLDHVVVAADGFVSMAENYWTRGARA